MKGRTLRLVGLLLALGLAIGCFCQFAAELMWFAEVGYTEVFWLRLVTQVGLWAIASIVSTAFLLGNLALAQRFKYSHLETTLALAKTQTWSTGRRDRCTINADRRSSPLPHHPHGLPTHSAPLEDDVARKRERPAAVCPSHDHE